MPEYSFVIFAADNLTNPNNPGSLPAEDATYMSDLDIGDQITWNGGGQNAYVTVVDPTGTTFDEAQSNQTLKDPVTFNGTSYSTGQVVTPTYTIVFSGSDGLTYTMTSFNFSPNTNNEEPDAVFWEGEIPPAGTVLTVTAELNPTASTSRPFADFAVCFAQGTLIETRDGPKPVETLTTQDWVATQRGSFEKVHLVCSRLVTAEDLARSPNLRPIVITQAALGRGMPTQDLRVSRQHRLSVSSPICDRMFGQKEVLVAAFQLTQLPGIYVDEDVHDLRYYHILLNQHEVIFANGAPAESLYLGENALYALTAEARAEVLTLFPDLIDADLPPEPAQLIPSGARQKQLITRHMKNAKALLD